MSLDQDSIDALLLKYDWLPSLSKMYSKYVSIEGRRKRPKREGIREVQGRYKGGYGEMLVR